MITGKVQGVFFRGSTREMAEQSGVKGEVKNMPDGSVQLIAEGEEETVDALIAWCHYGPPRAEVWVASPWNVAAAALAFSP